MGVGPALRARKVSKAPGYPSTMSQTTSNDRGNLTDATLALGSNLGDRLANLRAAVTRLEAAGNLLVTRVSRIYENRAVGMGEAGPFLNGALEVKTSLSPETLLDRCLAVEDSLGRRRAETWIPRTIDIDVLLYGEASMASERLVLPHPSIAERDFVVQPLLDIDPERSVSGTTVRALRDALGEIGLRRIDARLWPVPEVHIIAAVGANRVIGVDGHLPWSIPEDWEVFLRKTRGGTLVMGRVSFEDMRREPSWREDRRYVVVTSRPESVETAGATACSSLMEAVEAARRMGRPVWICGGEAVYREALALADRFHVTEVDGEFKGDTFFPPYAEAFPAARAALRSCDGRYRYVFKVLSR